MKKISFLLMAFGLMAASCTTSEFENVYGEDPHADFAKQFTQTFGQVAPNHDWGFGTAVRGASMRAANTWTDNHSCDWADKLNVVLPEGATEMTAPGWLSTGVYVVPTEGSVSLGWANFNDDDKIYILGNVTELKEANYNGKVTFYNVGTLTYSVSSGQRHTIINTGTLTIDNYANVGEVYNSGTLTLKANQYSWNGKADIPDAMSIFSTGEGSVLMPDGGDFKAAADIHGTLVADDDTKIQNSNTQYICGVKVDGVLDMTQGHLQSSNIEADEITFDGAEIWLTPGGHIKADVIRMPNSATAIYGEATSTGLIEVEDIYFQNTNNFDDSFSANIYFKVTGEIDFSNSTKFGGGAKHYADVEAYNDDNTTLKGYNSSDAASGSPECGQPWSVGTPEEITPDPEEYWVRIIAEDLAASNGSDFDYNDVVFDAYIDADNKAHIIVRAAGGTMPLYIGEVKEKNEVHQMFGVSTSTMVNTGVDGKAIDYLKGTEELVLDGTYTDYNQIDIIVVNGGKSYKLEAKKGQAAEKILVGTDYEWTEERQAVEDKHEGFINYVKHPEDGKWWN